MLQNISIPWMWISAIFTTVTMTIMWVYARQKGWTMKPLSDKAPKRDSKDRPGLWFATFLSFSINFWLWFSLILLSSVQEVNVNGWSNPYLSLSWIAWLSHFAAFVYNVRREYNARPKQMPPASVLDNMLTNQKSMKSKKHRKRRRHSKMVPAWSNY